MTFKRGCHGLCVIDRVLERREGIGGIADNQSRARLWRWAFGTRKESDAEQNT